MAVEGREDKLKLIIDVAATLSLAESFCGAPAATLLTWRTNPFSLQLKLDLYNFQTATRLL